VTRSPITTLALAFGNSRVTPARLVEEFESALQLKPDWADVRFSLGATLYELNDTTAARKELEAAR